MADSNTTKHADMGTTDSAKMTDTVNDGTTSADFKRRCRWAEYWRIRNKDRFDTEQTLWAKWFAESPELLSDDLWLRAASHPNWKFPNPIDMCSYNKSLEEWTSKAATSGFRTGLRAEKRSSRGPEGSQDLKCFLKALEEALLSETVDNVQLHNKTENIKSRSVRDCLNLLRDEHCSLVVVPTDKTNSFRTMEVEDYKKQMLQHLKSRAVEIPRSQLTEFFDQCNVLLSEHEVSLGDDEISFLTEKIKSKSIPQPKILIKDHKKADPDGHFPTCLVVPASNFTAGFPKLGYKGIKKIFEDNEIKFGQQNIIQASDLKKALEMKHIDCNSFTIASVDAVMMYPSIKYDLVERAVTFYSRDLDEESISTIDTCFQFIKFGMGSTILSFLDQFYLWDGDPWPYHWRL